MQHAPALDILPQRSRVHACAVMLLTIIMIALSADFMTASGQFGLKNVLWTGAAAGLLTWAWADVLRQPQGALRLAQGQWSWRKMDRADTQVASKEQVGTLQVHLDLQSYLLVRWSPQQSEQFLSGRIFRTIPSWFHLEARHFQDMDVTKPMSEAIRVAQPSWQVVRCAVYSSQTPLELDFSEKPAR
ncbi:MAG: hypothetical protein HC765_09685 [Brachymonas sp.]|nr:hypothetical protein [Brachymonas sp.]